MLIISTAFSFFISIIVILFLKKFFSQKSLLDYSNKPINNSKWLKFGIPVSLWSTIGLLLPFLDRFFINTYLNPSLLGSYSSLNDICIKAFSFLIFPFTMAIHPRVAKLWNENKKKDALKIISTTINAILIFIIFSIIILFLFKKFISGNYKTLHTNFIEETGSILVPMIITGIIWQLSFISHKLIELDEKTYLMIFFISISVLVNIIGNSLFLPRYGIVASAYVAFFCINILLFNFIYFLRKKQKY